MTLVLNVSNHLIDYADSLAEEIVDGVLHSMKLEIPQLEKEQARMKGAEATIVGAYDTTVYAVSYTPTTGGEKVTNHKWVIQEDLKDAGDTPYKVGDEVTLNVEHMEGMKGAQATIDTAEQTTIYMVDYTPTTGGERVKNHQWVTADELQPIEGGEHAGH
ncbi:DUF1541 domain-containing protein [Peribacillus saganii]|uniref:DUF1541 domain-containing protein n=1 Tax=Peribacillus saganii TaxID=2303992 RepID=A0A372LQ38_9BACI|nr:YdhK family protein [Peribacillus saganii]RFU69715.1 DUF1541 domain-containing protein [Peribacillus saganii]